MSEQDIRNAALEESIVDEVKQALRHSYLLGQKYWQQADSVSTWQNKLSDETEARHDKLVDDTVAMLRGLQSSPAPKQASRVDPDKLPEVICSRCHLKVISSCGVKCPVPNAYTQSPDAGKE